MNYAPVRIAIIGPVYTGKSCLSKALSGRKQFEENYSETVGVDFFYGYDESNTIKISIWDLTGSSLFYNIIHTYINTSDVLLFCYSCESYESFQDMKILHDKLKQNNVLDDKNIIVISNKIESSKKIDDHHLWAEEMCKEYSYIFHQTSVKNMTGILELKQIITKFAEPTDLVTVPLDIEEYDFMAAGACCHNCSMM